MKFNRFWTIFEIFILLEGKQQRPKHKLMMHVKTNRMERIRKKEEKQVGEGKRAGGNARQGFFCNPDRRTEKFFLRWLIYIDKYQMIFMFNFK